MSLITDGRPSMFEKSFQLPAKKRTDIKGLEAVTTASEFMILAQ